MNKIDIACLIDDDPIFTHLLSRQMQQLNFSKTILIFNNGLEALKYLRSNAESPEILPSVILLDLNMPLLDGWQFLDEFTQFNPGKKITIYIVSSSIDKQDHIKAANYRQISKFYIKPITKENLMEMLTEIER